MAEIWKPVVGYEGCYEVSNRGRVRSVDRIVQSRPGLRIALGGQVRKLKLDDWGYYRVILCRGGKNRSFRVHTLVLLAFRGPPPDPAMECRHLDGDPANNRLKNIVWAFHVDNCRDQVLHGTSNRGERNGLVKLTAFRVRAIRRKYAAGTHTKTELSRLYGVAFRTVGKVLSGTTWTHV